MWYSVEDVRALSYLDNLPVQQVEKGVVALNGLSSLLGKEWVDKLVAGYVTAFTLTLLIELWSWWTSIEQLDKSNQLLKRWKQGYREQGVEPELFVASRIVGAGFDLELEPACNTRVPDFRFRRTNGRWIYAEVAKRNFSIEQQKSQRVMELLAQQLLSIGANCHAQLALTRRPEGQELNDLSEWISSLSGKTNEKYEEVAEFFLSGRHAGVNAEKMKKKVPTPRLFQTRIINDNMATVCMPVIDRNINTILKHESEQLPKTDPAILFIDVSNVVGGVEEWTPLIASSYRPTIRTRISASIIFSTAIGPNNLTQEARLISNPYAALPLQDEEERQIRDIFARIEAKP